MQESAHAVLVSIHESCDDFCGRALQHGSWPVLVAAAGHGAPRASLVSRMVLVQPGGGPVWLGAAGDWTPGLGLFRVEGSTTEGQGLVYTEVADVLAGGGHSAAAALVDSGVPVLLAWGVVLVVTIILCIDPESRDYLLGHGRTLSIVSTGMLLLVLTMTVVGWSLTY